jgi:hypothetical protein
MRALQHHAGAGAALSKAHTQEALHRIEADMLALLRSVKPDATIEAAAH